MGGTAGVLHAKLTAKVNEISNLSYVELQNIKASGNGTSNYWKGS